MNKTQSTQDFITTNAPNIILSEFVIDLALTLLCCFALNRVYIQFGRSLSNRASLARNFIMLGATTMLIITIVKSSLALSLGLVGALSIVRFRTAIKEPEELAYLFICISIGLGFGANQRWVTLLGFVVIALTICMRNWWDNRGDPSSIYLLISHHGAGKPSLEQITETLRGFSTSLSLKRFDESGDRVEVSYRVSFADYGQLESAKNALRAFGDSTQVSFVDNEEIG